MKLCDVMQRIYRNELAKDNEVTVVTNHKRSQEYRASLVVYMKNRLGDYDLPYAEGKVFRAPWYPSERYYVCRECGCVVSGPLKNDQKGFYCNDLHRPPDPQVFATPVNVYWMEDDRYDDCLPPTVLSTDEWSDTH